MEELPYYMAYVVTESIRAIYEYYAFETTSRFTPPLIVLLSNCVKLTTASIYLWRRAEEKRLAPHSSIVERMADCMSFALPTVFELLASMIYYIALRFTSTLLLQTFMVTQIPATAVLHHIYFAKEENNFAWSSLTWLCLGLLMVNIPPTSFSLTAWLTAIVAGCLIGLCSALSIIWSQKLLKSGSFWASQFRLYAWGTIISILAYPLVTFISTWGTLYGTKPGVRYSPTINFSTSAPLIALTAVVGIILAVILRRKDSLVNLVGTSGSLLVSTVILNYGSTVLQEARLATWTTLGYIITAISIWLYSHYKTSYDSERAVLRNEKYQTIAQEEQIFASELENSEIDGDQHSPIEQPNSLDTFSEDKPISGNIRHWIFISRDSLRTTFITFCNAMSFGYIENPVPTTHAIKSGALSIVFFFVPSFISIGRDKHDTPITKIHPTAYLDGIRGFAALGVVTFHTIGGWLPRTLLGWDGTAQNLLIQLPWIHLIVSGNAMVAIFFVVSGFSLSYSPLKHIRSKDIERFSLSIASSVIRRHLRLLLPCTFLTFSLMLLVYTGADNGQIGVPRVPFSEQFTHWRNDILHLADPLRNINLSDGAEAASDFVAPTWTIPIELRGSMVVYMLLVGCSRLPSKVRITLISGLAIVFGHYLYWDMTLFLGGMVLAEAHLIRTESTTPSILYQGIAILTRNEIADTPTSIPKKTSFVINAFWIANFLLATYILSMPAHDLNPAGDPGYVFLWHLTPLQYALSWHWSRFWQMVGAIYLIFTVDNCRLLQAFFTLRFSKYLGFISFAIYLVHGPLMLIFAPGIFTKMWALHGSDSFITYWGGFCVSYLVMFILFFWVADIFARGIDQPCVNLSKWLYSKVLSLERA